MVTTLPNDVFLPFAPDKPWLAPLAGWSDLPFRLLCRRFGAAVCCTEMISAKGLIYKSPGTAELFATCPEDGPVVVQLFGSEAPFMEAAAGQLRAAPSPRWRARGPARRCAKTSTTPCPLPKP